MSPQEGKHRGAKFVHPLAKVCPTEGEHIEEYLLRATTTSWEEVERELFRAGVDRSQNAIAEAQRNGSDPGDVRALIAYWQAHRDGWGEHAKVTLYRRVCRCVRGESASDKWPPFDPGYRGADSSEERGAAMRQRRERWESTFNGLPVAEQNRLLTFVCQGGNRYDTEALRKQAIYELWDTGEQLPVSIATTEAVS